MSPSSASIIPQNPRLKSGDPIRNVADYIERVNQYIQMQPGGVFVYRGEPRLYDRPCIPNLYRGGILGENPFFERSLFDAMRQNRLTKESSYLKNAIDAQHGEFPSRLLDVTYNCLTALYFAVTPYYRKDADLYDRQDGAVYVFSAGELYSPSGQNTGDCYRAIISRDPEWVGRDLFGKNHKFIDYGKLNDRIIAQQGAFILFQGDSPEELPAYLYSGMIIPGSSKADIRRELKLLFGIHTGSVYPETVNLVEDLKEKSGRLNTEPFSLQSELDHVLRQLEKELDYYLDYAVSLRRANAPGQETALLYIEKIIDSYRKGLLSLHRDPPKDAAGDCLDRAAGEYSRLVRQFARELEAYGAGPLAAERLLELW